MNFPAVAFGDITEVKRITSLIEEEFVVSVERTVCV